MDKGQTIPFNIFIMDANGTNFIFTYISQSEGFLKPMLGRHQKLISYIVNNFKQAINFSCV